VLAIGLQHLSIKRNLLWWCAAGGDVGECRCGLWWWSLQCCLRQREGVQVSVCRNNAFPQCPAFIIHLMCHSGSSMQALWSATACMHILARCSPCSTWPCAGLHVRAPPASC